MHDYKNDFLKRITDAKAQARAEADAKQATRELDLIGTFKRMHSDKNLCIKCNHLLPVSSFSVKKDGNLYKWCKPCQRAEIIKRKRSPGIRVDAPLFPRNADDTGWADE